MSITTAICIIVCTLIVSNTLIEVCNIMSNGYDWMENPNNGRYVKVFHDQIETEAEKDNVFTKAEDMDDDTYYKYMRRAMGW